jgi:hypothetical protein
MLYASNNQKYGVRVDRADNADTVGGYTASQLMANAGGIVAQSFGSNTWQKFANGLIEQTIESNFSTNSGWRDITFTFPILFTVRVNYVNASLQSSENELTNNIRIKSLSLTAVTFSIYCNHDGTNNATVRCYARGR